ncbi:MAG: ABC transporter ATP-binding protein [Oscillibacter sp.]|jgi:branched-chain amino acid transport system ATP-binding protein|nr:ABC transporter ATP-binding protein [Oscillibacter sp.]
MNMLKMDKVCAGYGDLKVLFDISLEINEGEVVALVGSNGAGKTTLLRTISGEVIPTSGSIKWLGMELTKLPENKRAVNGIAHIPQGRGILASLSIKDNLLLGTYTKRTKPRRAELLENALQMFPILKERLNFPAGSLSGGQQQMLAIARAMMMAPKLLILDEPSLGLAPVVVDDVYRILDVMKRQGSSMLVIEQNLTKALSISDRGYVLETGHMQMTGPSKELLNNKDIQKAYLGI